MGDNEAPDDKELVHEAPRITALSTAERAALTGGSTYWETSAAPGLGLEALHTSDGPNGVRGLRWGSVSMCLPSPTALASTWNRDLVREVGVVLGAEARDRSAGVLLAPNVNLQRHPLGGRSFECFSEDPFLAAAMTVAYVRGVHSTGVASVVRARTLLHVLRLPRPGRRGRAPRRRCRPRSHQHRQPPGQHRGAGLRAAARLRGGAG